MSLLFRDLVKDGGYTSHFETKRIIILWNIFVKGWMYVTNKSAISFTIFKAIYFSRLLLNDLRVLMSSRISPLSVISKENIWDGKENNRMGRKGKGCSVCFSITFQLHISIIIHWCRAAFLLWYIYDFRKCFAMFFILSQS